MKKMSLKKKIIMMVFAISMVAPLIAGIIIYRNRLTTEMYQTISDESLPRTRQMGDTLSKFKEIRIKVRDLSIRGNNAESVKKDVTAIVASIEEFVKSKEQLQKMMSKTEEERRMSAEMDARWQKFYTFGGGLLKLAQQGDEASLNNLATQVREICPGLSEAYLKTITDMIAWQDEVVRQRTALARENDSATNLLSIVVAIIAVVFSVTGGVYFSTTLSRNINLNMKSSLKAPVRFRINLTKLLAFQVTFRKPRPSRPQVSRKPLPRLMRFQR